MYKDLQLVSIYTSDWHLDDRDCNAYRWEIFPWLCDLIRKEKVRYLFFLGDLCDSKDNHSGVLVNRIVRSLRTVVKALNEVSDGNGRIWMLTGNHDFVSAENPFFKFLHRSIQGRINYVTRATEIGFWKQRFLFLPYTKDWGVYSKYDLKEFDRVLIHQPIIGARTESGGILEDGLKLENLKDAKCVLAGDVHVPQTIKNLTYLGAPFPVRFGDTYRPRVLVERNGEFENVWRDTIRKESIKATNYTEILKGLRKGDQAKIELTLPRAEFGDWKQISADIQKQADAKGIRLAGLKLAEAKPKRKRLFFSGSKPVAREPAAVVGAYIKEANVEPAMVPFVEQVMKGNL